jgi:signal transduction histidine kinase/DNA-binding response OmpR family regulator
MNTLLQPAIRLMSRLRYPQKFALISLLFIIPLGLVMTLLFTELYKRVDFSQKEIHGTTYLRPLRVILQESIRGRIITAYNGTANDLQPIYERIDAAFVDLRQVDQRLGRTLDTGGQAIALERSWAELRTKQFAPGSREADNAYIDFISDTRNLISYVGDTSNLILDPDLDTYYLMDAILLKLPELQDLIGQTAVLGMNPIEQMVISDIERTRLSELSGRIRANNEAMQKGMTVAFTNNPTGNLRPIIGADVQNINGVLGAYINVIETQIILPASATSTPAGFQGASFVALDETFAFWDKTVEQLDALLAIRVNVYLRQVLMVLVIAGLALLIVGYLLKAFYVSVMATVQMLEAATNRMISNNFDNGIVLDTRDEMGQIVRSFNMIAERLRNEWQQAQESQTRAEMSEAELRTLFSAMTDVVLMIDHEGRYIKVAPTRALRGNIANGQLEGKLMHDVLPPAIATKLQNYIQQALDRQQMIKTEYKLDIANEDVWFDATITPMSSDAVYLVSREITEYKRISEDLEYARDRAEEANRAKSTFLANMSHELRTPLNAIIGYSEMLREDANDNGQPEMVEDLLKIHSAGHHLLNLINDILDLSKIEAGRMDLHLEEFDIAQVVRDVVVTIRPLILGNNNRLNLELSNDLGTMYADVTKVRQSLFNLLSNASKFTNHGTITLRVTPQQLDLGHNGADLRTRRTGSMVVFEIIDTGIGMSQSQIDRLFQPFIQADSSTTRKYGGTGLGLTITKRFSQMMGGDVTVKSAVNHGSTFTITLPLQVEQTLPEAKAFLELPTNQKPVVLVIDDDRQTFEHVEHHLRNEGYDVRFAGSGQEGLEKAEILQPAVILLDVLMPSMDGWAVLSTLKSSPTLSNIPVIIISMTDSRQMGITLGASEYIAKPIDRAKLASILSRYRSLRSNAPVLVVEDDPNSRQMLRRMLEREGWGVREAVDGREALQAIQEEAPRLILLDLMMPEIDGFEVLAHLKQHDTWSNIPIIVITAKDLTNDDRIRLTGRVERIIQKGAYQRGDLLAEVRQLVATWAQPRQKELAS